MSELQRREWMKAAVLGLVAAGAGCVPRSSSESGAGGKEFAEAFGPDWELKKANAIEVAEAMPAEKYSFKPTEEMRSFGELMVHLGQTTFLFASIASGEEQPENTQAPEDPTKENVVPYLQAAFDFAVPAVGAVDDAKARESIDVFNGAFTMTRRKVCEFMRDHVSHHLGYAIPYLRLAGLKEVPAYRFTGQNQSPV